MSKETEKSCRLGAVGGQAVLEGVMMKHGDRYSVAVRKEDGEIAVSDNEFVSVRKKHKILNIPILRGAVNMVEMLALSIKTLNISAQLSGIEEEVEETKFEKWLREHFGKGILDLVMVLATVMGVALSLFLFLFLPSFLTKALESAIGWITWSNFEFGWWRNLLEGAFKIIIFVSYLALTLLMKDIRRTFEYHGAEHKSIFCYEAGEELTPENVKKYKRFHPRCGTSFMFVIIILGVVVSSLPIFSWDNIFLRFITRLLFLPITIGLGYEFIRFAGKHDNLFTRILSAPGLWMQRITTREPDLEQIEVAIRALKSSMPEEFPEQQATACTENDDICAEQQATACTENNDVCAEQQATDCTENNDVCAEQQATACTENDDVCAEQQVTACTGNGDVCAEVEVEPKTASEEGTDGQ